MSWWRIVSVQTFRVQVKNIATGKRGPCSLQHWVHAETWASAKVHPLLIQCTRYFYPVHQIFFPAECRVQARWSFVTASWQLMVTFPVFVTSLKTISQAWNAVTGLCTATAADKLGCSPDSFLHKYSIMQNNLCILCPFSSAFSCLFNVNFAHFYKFKCF